MLPNTCVYFFLWREAPVCVCFRDGRQVLGSKPELLAALFALTSDLSIAVAKDCYFILVNLSADRSLHQVSCPEQLCSRPSCAAFVMFSYGFSDFRFFCCYPAKSVINLCIFSG